MANNYKDEREDTDGDEMDHESEDSDVSSITSDSSYGTHSDDGSELDIEECERRRIECQENLGDKERQFDVFKEHDISDRGKLRGQLCVSSPSTSPRVYREKITQINKQLKEVREGVAKEFCEPLEELKENMRVRIEVAEVLKKLRLENIENCFQAEEMAALQNFENEKLLLFDSMKKELEERIQKLEDDRNNIDLHSDSFYNSEKSKNRSYDGKVTSRKIGLKRPVKRKPVTVRGPYIVYMLTEAEILEDWTIIKKALQNTRRKEMEKQQLHQF